MSVSVRVDDSRLQSWIREEPTREVETLRLFQEEGSFMVMSEMRLRVPFRTGFLRESIVRQFTPAGFTVYPTAKYAEVVEKGAAPHTIFPVRAQVLAWESPYGGTIFAKHVYHPGFQGRWFVKATAEAVRERLADLCHSILERLHL
jgi:hypothetical protein